MAGAGAPRIAAAAAFAWIATGVRAEAPPRRPRHVRAWRGSNNMPLSNSNGEGYENKIARWLARELGWKTRVHWFPQRMGFHPQTLKARVPDQDRFKCDLVSGVPVGYELTLTTPAYYRRPGMGFEGQRLD